MSKFVHGANIFPCAVAPATYSNYMNIPKKARGRPKTHECAVATYVYLSKTVRDRASELARSERRSLSAQLAVLIEKALAS